MGGRPSDYSEEIADEICSRITRGESLTAICADKEGGWLPSESTVYRWLEAHGEFREKYARAREAQADKFFDEIIAIADAPNASIDPETGSPVIRDPQRDRLRVDARKWVASKLAPKRYGDKLELEHSGSINLTPEHRRAEIDKLLAKRGLADAADG